MGFGCGGRVGVAVGGGDAVVGVWRGDGGSGVLRDDGLTVVIKKLVSASAHLHKRSDRGRRRTHTAQRILTPFSTSPSVISRPLY